MSCTLFVFFQHPNCCIRDTEVHFLQYLFMAQLCMQVFNLFLNLLPQFPTGPSSRISLHYASALNCLLALPGALSSNTTKSGELPLHIHLTYCIPSFVNSHIPLFSHLTPRLKHPAFQVFNSLTFQKASSVSSVTPVYILLRMGRPNPHAVLHM